MTGEPEAIAMINVAKRLFDAGYNKECDSVLDLCKNIFPRESSLCGSLWKSTQVCRLNRRKIYIHTIRMFKYFLFLSRYKLNFKGACIRQIGVAQNIVWKVLLLMQNNHGSLCL